jgi:urease accessory protein
MPRVQKVLASSERGGLASGPQKGTTGGAQPGEIADTLLLTFDDRRRQQGFVFGAKGTCVAFDFPEPPRLRTDDLLLLDDGRLVEVVADIEPVIEVRAKDFASVARLILTLGNRHIPVQLLANRIRLQKRPDIEALAAEHGLKAVEIAAPFEPDERAHGREHERHHPHGDGRSDHHHHDHAPHSHGDHHSR